MRKRISLTVVTALTAGLLTSVVTGPVTNAHSGSPSTTATNVVYGTATKDASLLVAEDLATDGGANAGTVSASASLETGAESLGLLAKDTSSGVAQTATVLTSGVLSLYAHVGTNIAYVVSGGTLSSVTNTASYSQDKRTALAELTSATGSAALWTAPSTAGTYTISSYSSNSTGVGTTMTSLSTVTSHTLSGRITVTVVATSAGGSYSPVYSVCNTSSTTVVPGSTASTANIDSTATVTNGGVWYVNFALNDSYNQDLDNGNIVVTATNGALVNYGEGTASGGGTAVAGTASTVVSYNNAGPYGTVTVAQGTANAPVTTTVTVKYNETTVCTKTVTIRGEVAKLTVSNIITQDLNGTSGIANGSWIADGSGRAGLFTVLATDSAGNQVATSSIGTFSSVAASLAGQTTITSITVDGSATATSSTAAQRYSTGIYACGPVAGELKTAKIQFTNTGTGNTVSSDAFTLRCADNPYTYTASWDKATYAQGEVATLTVKFLDSKGFAANNVAAGTGSWTGVTPMLTPISATGAAPVLDNQGTVKYTYSVGGTTAVTAGSYVSVIDFQDLVAVAATKQTPSYKVTTGSTDVSFTEVLKSVVALIASINKQIQALQKLILKR